jgi:4'-phosphopantetheinyl transferase
VHVWVLRAPEDASADDVARAQALLSAEERARMARFRFAPDRLRYLFAHALVRVTLSRHAPATPPADWRFVANAYGRPEVAPDIDTGPLPLRFNLSHTAGLVACAVALDREIGVDVEHLFPRGGDFGLDVAARYFASAELAGLGAQPDDARRERFFALWTLKEAYIKARGLGLALPLDRFAFELEGAPGNAAESPAIAIRFEPDMNDDATRWHFVRRHPTPEHALALATRRAPGETVSVLVSESGLGPAETG